ADTRVLVGRVTRFWNIHGRHRDRARPAPHRGRNPVPTGFVTLVLLGLELATGNFAILPAGFMGGEVSFMKVLRNWTWVYLGNLVGCVFYAFLFYLTVTNFGATSSGPVGEMLKAAAQKKTL